MQVPILLMNPDGTYPVLLSFPLYKFRDGCCVFLFLLFEWWSYNDFIFSSDIKAVKHRCRHYLVSMWFKYSFELYNIFQLILYTLNHLFIRRNVEEKWYRYAHFANWRYRSVFFTHQV